jgi:hypothetical protein
MSQNLMAQLIKHEEFCCIYGFFCNHKEKTNRELADYLGVTANTVRMWRRRIREDEVTCGYGASGHGGCIYREP